VDDDVAKIEQHPARVQCAFLVVRQDTFLFQRLLYFIVDSTYLPFALTTADNEVTGKTANLTDIEQDDIGSLFLAGSSNCFSRYIYCIQ
jgi:hypothetical protein